MRIACPECNAAYDVPAAQLAPGRAVRCVRCRSVWVPVATDDAVPEIQPQPDPARPVLPDHADVPEMPGNAEAPPPDRVPEPLDAEPAAAEPRPAPPQARRRTPPVLVGWLVTVLVLAEFAYVATRYRGAIMQAWPASERVYALFGVELEGTSEPP